MALDPEKWAMCITYHIRRDSTGDVPQERLRQRSVSSKMEIRGFRLCEHPFRHGIHDAPSAHLQRYTFYKSVQDPDHSAGHLPQTLQRTKYSVRRKFCRCSRWKRVCQHGLEKRSNALHVRQGQLSQGRQQITLLSEDEVVHSEGVEVNAVAHRVHANHQRRETDASLP